MKPISLQIQPNRWSCSVTAWAMAMDMDVQDLIEIIGHDGSEKHGDYPDPSGRVGFHFSELTLAALKLGYSFTPVQLFPVSLIESTPVQIKYQMGSWDNWDVFRTLIQTERGVIDGIVRHNHSVAFDRGHIYDPSGMQFPYSRDACELRGFVTRQLWIMKSIQH